VCVYDDARLLPHFTRHYKRFGVSEFHIAAPPHLADDIVRYATGYDVRQYNQFDVADSFTGGVAAVTAMRELAQAPNEAVVIVDLDEFVEFDAPVTAIVARMDAEGANVARGIMFDRFAASGQPVPFDDDSDLPTLYPIRARFTRDVMGGVDVKGVVVRGRLKSQGAHHYFENERIFSTTYEISHFKWNERSLGRVGEAYETLSALGIPWAWQYKRILDHYEAHGRFAWETFGGEFVAAPTPDRPFVA